MNDRQKLAAKRTNETLKLSASALNNLSVGLFVGGFVGPTATGQPLTLEWVSFLTIGAVEDRGQQPPCEPPCYPTDVIPVSAQTGLLIADLRRCLRSGSRSPCDAGSAPDIWRMVQCATRCGGRGRERGRLQDWRYDGASETEDPCCRHLHDFDVVGHLLDYLRIVTV